MKHTQKMIVNFRKDFAGKDEYVLNTTDMTTWGMGYVKVCEVDVEFESPDDFNAVSAQVEALKAKKEKLVAAFTKDLDEITEEISKLECLEYSA